MSYYSEQLKRQLTETVATATQLMYEYDSKSYSNENIASTLTQRIVAIEKFIERIEPIIKAMELLQVGKDNA